MINQKSGLSLYFNVTIFTFGNVWNINFKAMSIVYQYWYELIARVIRLRSARAMVYFTDNRKWWMKLKLLTIERSFLFYQYWIYFSAAAGLPRQLAGSLRRRVLIFSFSVSHNIGKCGFIIILHLIDPPSICNSVVRIKILTSTWYWDEVAAPRKYN